MIARILKSFRLRSIRQKLVGVVLLATLSATSISLAGIVAYDLNDDQLALIADLTVQANQLGQALTPALAAGDQGSGTDDLGRLPLHPPLIAVAIYTPQGGMFASRGALDAHVRFPARIDRSSVSVEGSRLTLVQSIVIKEAIVGRVYLVADDALFDRIAHYSGIVVAAMLFAVLLALLLIGRIERIVTRPVYAITETARGIIESRDYARRAARRSDDEFGSMVDAFNAMVEEIECRTLLLETSNREIVRETNERNAAQGEVLRLNAELEQRVSERTRELVVAKEVAEQATEAKTTFLSSMSHELRTPLNAILGFAQLLGSETLTTTPEQKKDSILRILKAGRHLLALINEILDLAKVEAGQVMLSPEPVALAEILLECQAMVEPMGNQRSIRMMFPMACELSVLADRTRLKQVLLNLLSNAIKYNREAGVVVVECDPATPDRVRISVRDTGEGLSPENVAKLFHPFERLGQEAGGVEGTGIGLVVTKRLVQLMGGAIGITSVVGTGSVFWIELKAAELAQPSSPRGGGEASKATAQILPFTGDKATLLYVEDNPANLALVEEVFAARGDIHVISAPDGRLGVQLARAHQPGVILMDIHLPGMSGGDAQQILRGDPTTAHIPVIALTASAMPREIEMGLAAGFFRYVTKPIDLDELIEAVDSALAVSAARAGHSEAEEL